MKKEIWLFFVGGGGRGRGTPYPLFVSASLLKDWTQSLKTLKHLVEKNEEKLRGRMGSGKRIYIDRWIGKKVSTLQDLEK